MMESGKSLDETWIKLNVGGRKFLTTNQTLQSIPNTKLANLDQDISNYDKSKETYNFDRDSLIFAKILQCYRNGKVHFTPDTCIEAVIEEFKFWQLDVGNYLSPCCIGYFQEYCEGIELAHTIQKDYEKEIAEEEKIHERMAQGSKFERNRMKLWLFLDQPGSSTAAKWWAIFQIALTFAVMILYAILTALIYVIRQEAPWILNTSQPIAGTNVDEIVLQHSGMSIQLVLRLEIALNTIFILDLVLRFITAPEKCKFLCQLHSIIDILCLLVFVCYETLSTINHYWGGYMAERSIFTNFILMVQVLRLAKLTKLKSSYVQLKALLLSLRHSLVEIAITMLLLMAVLFLLAVIAYQLEHRAPDTQMPHVPRALWWSLITMTTVGYGDTLPRTAGGYILGGLVPLLGILLTGLAISILANNVSICSQLAARQQRLRQQQQQARRKKAPPVDEAPSGGDHASAIFSQDGGTNDEIMTVRKRSPEREMKSNGNGNMHGVRRGSDISSHNNGIATIAI